ncbi:MAG: arsenate reductase [Flavobacterium sp.]|nr:arsenate reductase [Candidatus Neoflavobacterium equi]
MNTIFYLKTCDTCKRILSELPGLERFELIDIKSQPITADQLDQMYQLSGSYEKLFSKRAQLYKELNLKEANLDEAGFRKYLLEHYTFLARPVIIFDHKIYIGNSAKNVEAVKAALAI